jgi:hypothetical protein
MFSADGGDSNFAAANSPPITFSGPNLPTALSLQLSANPSNYGQPVTLTATLTPYSVTGATTDGAHVNFITGTGSLGYGTLSSGVATLAVSSLPVGVDYVYAYFPAINGFEGTFSSTPSITIRPATLTVSGPDISRTYGAANPSLTGTATGAGGSTSATASPGGQAVYTLMLSPPNGETFPSGIDLTVSGLPAGATATFSPSSIPAGSGATKVTLTIQLEASTSLATKPMLFGHPEAPLVLGFIVFPFAVGKRRRTRGEQAAFWLAALVCACAMDAACLTGCGGGGGGGTGTQPQPQTYTFTVTATSGSASDNLTLLRSP